MLTDESGRRYELLRRLGRGGYGDVYLGRTSSAGGLRQYVALKLLNEDIDPRDQALERLTDEARLLASLDHPVVVAAHDLVVLDGRPTLVTEYVEGQDLSECLQPPHPMPRGAVLEVVEAVAGALDAAWTQLHVVHRDVKPQNIRVGIHGNVKLLDFGIAHSALIDRDARTGEESLVGTLRFLAPERFDLDAGPDPASDIFSLGCVLFQGWTGRSFYDGLEYPQILRLALDEDAFEEHLRRQLSSHMPPYVFDLMRGMLAYNTAERMSAGQVARACDIVSSQWPRSVSLRRWCREHPWPPSLETSSEAGPSGPVRSGRVRPSTSMPMRVPSSPLDQSSPKPLEPRRHLEPASAPSLLAHKSDILPSAESVRPRGRTLARVAVVVGLLGMVFTGLLVMALVVTGMSGWPSLGEPNSATIPTRTMNERVRADGTPSLPRPSEIVSPITLPNPVAVEAPAAPLNAAKARADAVRQGSRDVPAKTVVEVPASREVRAAKKEPSASQKEDATPGAGDAPKAPSDADVASTSTAAATSTPPSTEGSEAALRSADPFLRTPVQATYDVTFDSVPAGASVRRMDTRELLGITPLTMSLPAGEYQVRMSLEGQLSSVQTIRVGRRKPVRYAWTKGDGHWESAYDAGP